MFTDAKRDLMIGSSRRGIALAVALLLTTLVVAMIFLMTESATSASSRVSRLRQSLDAAAAVEAVLLRREHDVARLAVIGDAASITRWSTGNPDDGLGAQNYGVDTVNEFDVRWKIEPCMTAPVGGPDGATDIPYAANPSPDPTAVVAADSTQILNDTLYLFRVAAEASEHAPTGEKPRRAQGVRYVSMNREPLFRNVLFYAQKGAKGDLELSHAGEVTIAGNVHTNGALYIGSGLKVNDTIAQRGSISGELAPSKTLIGPETNPITGVDGPVRVNGLDGIFRLSKPLMFTIINDFPKTSTSLASVGSPSGSWDASASYNLASGNFPKQESGGTLDTLTIGGTVINPYRIKDGSGAITTGPADTLLTGASVRAINGVPLLGTNDARDNDRTEDARKWVKVAKTDFDAHARTRENGAVYKAVQAKVLNRGLEPQVLSYFDDKHENAQLSFLNSAGNPTLDLSRVEDPGYYVTLALGNSDAALVRRTNGEGWDVHPKTAPTATPAEGLQGGLLIRERPIPATDYWPGTSGTSVVDQAHPRYLPYAYGKQWYPTISPFTPIDVSDNLMRTWRWDVASPSVTANISQAATNRLVSYNGGGSLSLSAACNPGPSSDKDGSWSSYDGTSYPSTAVASNAIRRKTYFYRDAWRFVHLGKYAPADGNGLRLYYYLDQATTATTTENTYQDEVLGKNYPLPFVSGTDSAIAITNPSSGVVSTSGGVLAWASAPSPPSTTFWSARWVGFYRPDTSGLYGFTNSTASSPNHVVRLWINNQRVWEVNTDTTGGSPSVPNYINLTRDRYYPIVVEFASKVVGAPGAGPTLSYQIQGGNAGTIPSTALFPPATTGLPPIIPRTSFSALQCRIDNPQALLPLAQAKLGLMVRSEQAVSPLQQGGSAYAMIGWSPTRGFFTQRRGEPTRQSLRSIGTYYIGNGNGPTGPADAIGQIFDNPSSVATVRRTATFSEVARGAATSVSTYETQIAYGTPSYSSQPTLYPGPMTRDLDGGKIWTINTPFWTGSYVGSRTATLQKRRKDTKTRTQTLTMTGQLGSFLATDDNKTIWFFDQSTGTTLLNNTTATTVGTRTSNRTWYWSNASGVGQDTPSTSITRTWSSSGNGAWVSGTVLSVQRTPPSAQGMTTPTTAFGDAETAWASGAISITKNGVTTNATASDLTTFLGQTITTIKTTATPTWPAYSPSPAATAYPSDAATRAPSPAVQNPTLADFSTGRTFGVQRTGDNIWFDLNPWITNAGSWLSTLAGQYLPRGALYPTDWTGNATTAWPLTSGLRPDLWATSTAITATSTPSVTTSAVDNATAISNVGVVTGGNGYEMRDDEPATGFNTATEVWLRIERSAADVLTFRYYRGTTAPTGPNDPGWTSMSGTLNIANWGPSLLLGPCLQSGSSSTKVTATFSKLSIETTLAAPYDVIDQMEWDTSTSSSQDDLSRYLISQYQVFFGTRDITEDFLTWPNNITSRRLVDESWIYQPREFWSQSRWWDTLSAAGSAREKDPFTIPDTTFTSTTNRQLLSKTTLLNLDLEMIQQYLRTRTIGTATSDVISSIGPTPLANADSTKVLSTMFNGLIYAARTNRYPWNPNSNPGLASQTPAVSGTNPYSPTAASTLPNSLASSVTAGLDPRIINGTALSSWSDPSLLLSGVHKLEPYGLAVAPAFKPQLFHHGVRIINGKNINWKYPTGGTSSANTEGGYDWTHSANPKFGSCSLSVVTPNQLYVQGSLNVDRHKVVASGYTEPQMKYTPLGIMGDQVTLLSNAWTDSAYRMDGLTVTNSYPGVSGTGTLACSGLGTQASNTSYHAGIVTNNIPTTRQRVMEGQAAPFVDTTLFLENWQGAEMHYLGSFVVLDSRRYTQAFLHGSLKTYGTTPFGITACVDANSVSADWLNFWQRESGTNLPFPAAGSQASAITADWSGCSPAVYSEPTRRYQFNYDFRTLEGTPPFVPFGVSSGGIGGWVRSFE